MAKKAVPLLFIQEGQILWKNQPGKTAILLQGMQEDLCLEAY
jgi:hypothetical protein